MSKYKLEELGCYGRGTPSLQGGELICTCVEPDRFSPTQYCEVCAPGYINWPTCNVQDCGQDPPFCDETGSTSCDDSQFQTSSCGGNAYNPKTDTCCSYSDADGQQFGNTYITADFPGHKCCGNTTCGATEECKEYTTLVANGASPNGYRSEKQYTCEDSFGKTECELKALRFGKVVTVGFEWCLPHQTCCFEGCCSGTGDTCEEPLADASLLLPGGYTDARGNSLAGQRTDIRRKWKLSDGSTLPEELRLTCQESTAMSAPSAVLIAVLPTTLIVAVIVSTLFVFMSAGMGSIKVAGPALISIALCVFLIFGNSWPFALLAVLSSLTAIGAQAAESESKHIYSTLFQFLVLAILIGGWGMGSLIVNSGGILSSAAGSDTWNWNVLTNCTNYYNYFTPPDNLQWDMEATTEGYCSHTWKSWSMGCAAILIGMQFLQMVGSATLMTGDK